MSQTTMSLLEVVEREVHAAEQARRDVENEQWANYGKGVGLLTLDALNRNNRPNWQWDDYAI